MANASAMVFGADTMVTVTSGRLRRESEATKIHVLYEDPPCSLMIHGRTRFCGWPWATIVSAYRKQHPQPHATVKEIAGSFFEWLDYTPLISPEARVVEARLNAENVAREALSEARMLMDDGRARDLPEALDRVIPLIQEQITAATGSQSTRGGAPALDMDGVLAPYETAPRRVRRRLRDLTWYASASGLSEDGTGLVFGGYGDHEYLPSLVHLPGLRRVEDGIDIGTPSQHNVSLSNASIFQTYAHDHGMRALTSGVHAQVGRSLVELCGAIVAELTARQEAVPTGDAASAQLDPKRAVALTVSRKLFQQLQGAWASMEEERRAQFRAAITHMAPHELVELVTLLVTSASVGERMAVGVDTEVGGSVDILVMSREPATIRRITTRGYQLDSLPDHHLT
jgi:hypothetical protein